MVGDQHRREFTSPPASHDRAADAAPVLGNVLSALPAEAERLRTQLALRAAGLFTWELDPVSQTVTYSPNVIEVLGFVPGETFVEALTFIHPDDQENVRTHYRRALHGEEELDLDYRVLHPGNGAEVWVQSQGQLAAHDPERSALLIGVTQDISERKHTEEALREREARLQIALDAANLLTWDLDLRTYEAIYSPGFAALLGVPATPERVPPEGWQELIVAEDRPKVTQALADAIEKDAAIDIEFRVVPHGATEPHWFDVWGTIVKDPTGRPHHFLGVSMDVTERNEAEAALRASQERYQTLFTSIDEGFCVIEVLFDDSGKAFDYRFEEVNPAFERLTGLRDATGKRMREFAPDHEEYWFETYGQVALTGEPARFVASAAALGNIWFDLYAFRLNDDSRRVAVLFTDITERRRTEEALRRSEERLRRTTEIETVGIMYFHMDGTVTDANDAFLRMSGYSREELEAGGLSLETMTPPEWRPRLHHAAEELLALGRNTPYEKEYQRKDGSRWWGLFAATRLDDDEAVKFIIDITDAKRAEAERARLAKIVASSRDSIIGIDISGAVTDWNRGAEELYGYRASEVVGKKINLLIPEDRTEEWLQCFARLQAGEVIAPFETIRLRKDGRRIDVELMLSPITDHRGRLVGVAGVARNATLRKQQERALQDFLGMASHDLRTPITVLRAQAQLMRRRQAYDDHGIGVILDQTRRMERLVEDLQDAARLETGQIELHLVALDAADLVQQAVERARSQTFRHDVRMETPDVPVVGWWDRDRIGQVLDNLLSNAIKYSPNGGEIVATVAQSEDMAIITVTDQGTGIPQELQAKLFERFYRADSEGIASGLGLGLYITQMLVSAHGGEILIESAPERGSTFTIALPLGEPPSDEEPQA